MRALLSLLLLATACSPEAESSGSTSPAPGAFSLSSSAFTDGETIPTRYTCHGDDVSPPLAWTGAPEGTAAFVLQLLDPDANDFLHWTVGGLPADTTSLAEGASPDGLPAASWELANTFGSDGYRGPCPPAAHTYVFTLYALDAQVDAPANGTGLADTLGAHVLGTATLHGVFGGR